MIQGKTIVFTGKISKPRHEFQALVEAHGGIASSDVSRNTDYLVVGEKPGSKLFKAKEYGVKEITEQEFLTLLTPIEETEIPLTPQQLNEINSHLVTLVCLSCNKQYKQWDTSPDTSTCPLCEILIEPPRCPHCDNNPVIVTDYNLYHCMLCGTWFKAPHSIHSRHTKHLHYFQITKQTDEGIYKTCLACNITIFLTNSDIQYQKSLYEKAPNLVKEWKEEEKKTKEAQRKEEEMLKFLNALTPEQINQLKEDLNGKL